MTPDAAFFSLWLQDIAGAAGVTEARRRDWETQVLDLARFAGEAWAGAVHGERERWEAALARLPPVPRGHALLQQPCVQWCDSNPSQETIDGESLAATLMTFHPWRKGPFQIGPVQIETEWRSDWKWDRLASALGSLEGMSVLDIGCGSGYHLWRMLGQGARRALGVEPVLLYAYQFRAIQHFLGFAERGMIVPTTFEALPRSHPLWDVVFSMGVLYHRKDPLGHLEQIRDVLLEGGRLVLETLVVEGNEQTVLFPHGRYAQMRNVWFLPSVPQLVLWLQRLNFQKVEVIDVSVTTPGEQRSTPWMQFDSLPQFLDPVDPSRTVEGLPAPRRALVMAQRG